MNGGIEFLAYGVAERSADKPEHRGKLAETVAMTHEKLLAVNFGYLIAVDNPISLLR